MSEKLKVGDRVFTDEFYGEIVRIDSEVAIVKIDAGNGGGFLPFNLSELTKAKDKEFPRLQLHDFVQVGGNKEMRFFLTDEYEQFDGIVHPDEDFEFKEESITEVWRQVDEDTFKCIYRREN